MDWSVDLFMDFAFCPCLLVVFEVVFDQVGGGGCVTVAVAGGDGDFSRLCLSDLDRFGFPVPRGMLALGRLLVVLGTLGRAVLASGLEATVVGF